MILDHAVILCSYEYATHLSLFVKESSSSSENSSGQLMISCSKTSKTFFQVLMESTTHGVVSDRTSAFGFESSPDASSFFVSFHGAIILKKIELSYPWQEKSVSSTLNRKLLIANGKNDFEIQSALFKKFNRSSYSSTDEEFIKLNGIHYLVIHNIYFKSLTLINHKCH